MQWIGSEMMNWLGVSSKALNFYAEFPAAQGVIRFFISVYQSIWVHQKRAENNSLTLPMVNLNKLKKKNSFKIRDFKWVC